MGRGTGPGRSDKASRGKRPDDGPGSARSRKPRAADTGHAVRAGSHPRPVAERDAPFERTHPSGSRPQRRQSGAHAEHRPSPAGEGAHLEKRSAGLRRPGFRPAVHRQDPGRRDLSSEDRAYTAGAAGDVGAVLAGRRPVLEALRAERPLTRLLVDVDSLATGIGGSLRPILALAKEQGVPVERVKRVALDRLAQGALHQGVAALSSAAAYAEPGTVRDRALAAGPHGFVLALDGIEDPRNLGALLRTAEAAGVQGVILPARRAAGLTPAAVKASAGATEHVPVERVVNLVRELIDFKEAGFWLVGSAPDGARVAYEADLRSRPVVVVVGSEGHGLHRLVRDSCDEIVRLPMLGQIASLNASVAGALLLYEVVRQRSTP